MSPSSSSSSSVPHCSLFLFRKLSCEQQFLLWVQLSVRFVASAMCRCENKEQMYWISTNSAISISLCNLKTQHKKKMKRRKKNRFWEQRKNSSSFWEQLKSLQIIMKSFIGHHYFLRYFSFFLSFLKIYIRDSLPRLHS